jgi:hypothetical protein
MAARGPCWAAAADAVLHCLYVRPTATHRRQRGLSRSSGGEFGGQWPQLHLLLLEVVVNSENFFAAIGGTGCTPRDQLAADHIYEELVVSQKVHTQDGETGTAYPPFPAATAGYPSSRSTVRSLLLAVGCMTGIQRGMEKYYMRSRYPHAASYQRQSPE